MMKMLTRKRQQQWLAIAHHGSLWFNLHVVALWSLGWGRGCLNRIHKIILHNFKIIIIYLKFPNYLSCLVIILCCFDINC